MVKIIKREEYLLKQNEKMNNETDVHKNQVFSFRHSSWWLSLGKYGEETM